MVKNMFKSKFKNIKDGYSLMEMCVVLVIVAIFIALMANVVPHKPKEKVTAEAHGRFECYYDGDVLKQQMYTEGSAGALENADWVNETEQKKLCEKNGISSSDCKPDRCVFTPPSWARYMIIDAVGGGGGGNDNDGGTEGEYQSAFFASVHNKYYAVPGKGGEAGKGGDNSYVRLENEWKSLSTNDVLMQANGGNSIATLESASMDNVISCVVSEHNTNSDFDCGIYPNCEITTDGFKVSFCRNKNLYRTDTIKFKETGTDNNVITGDPRNVVNTVMNRVTTKKCKNYDSDTLCAIDQTSNVCSGDTDCEADTWVYHDISYWSDYSDDTNPIWYRPDVYSAYTHPWIPDYSNLTYPTFYTLEIKMDLGGSGDDEGAESNMTRFVNSMKYPADGIAKVKPGNGGAKGSKGHTGAVLFLW